MDLYGISNAIMEANSLHGQMALQNDLAQEKYQDALDKFNERIRSEKANDSQSNEIDEAKDVPELAAIYQVGKGIKGGITGGIEGAKAAYTTSRAAVAAGAPGTGVADVAQQGINLARRGGLISGQAADAAGDALSAAARGSVGGVARAAQGAGLISGQAADAASAAARGSISGVTEAAAGQAIAGARQAAQSALRAAAPAGQRVAAAVANIEGQARGALGGVNEAIAQGKTSLFQASEGTDALEAARSALPVNLVPRADPRFNLSFTEHDMPTQSYDDVVGLGRQIYAIGTGPLADTAGQAIAGATRAAQSAASQAADAAQSLAGQAIAGARQAGAAAATTAASQAADAAQGVLTGAGRAYSAPAAEAAQGILSRAGAAVSGAGQAAAEAAAGAARGAAGAAAGAAGRAAEALAPAARSAAGGLYTAGQTAGGALSGFREGASAAGGLGTAWGSELTGVEGIVQKTITKAGGGADLGFIAGKAAGAAGGIITLGTQIDSLFETNGKTAFSRVNEQGQRVAMSGVDKAGEFLNEAGAVADIAAAATGGLLTPIAAALNLAGAITGGIGAYKDEKTDDADIGLNADGTTNAAKAPKLAQTNLGTEAYTGLGFVGNATHNPLDHIA